MADTTRHVVLTNPGDLLLIGGVGQLPDGALEEVTDFFIAAGLKVAVFEEVVQIGSFEEVGMANPMWVVEWQEDGIRHHAIRCFWRDAMRWGCQMAGRWGGPVRVMSERTYLEEQPDG